MGQANYFKLGAWRAQCDRCGLIWHNFDLRKEWDGLMVCRYCWEPRNQQELIRPPKDSRPPPWTRPRPPDVFLENNFGTDKFVVNGTMLNGVTMG